MSDAPAPLGQPEEIEQRGEPRWALELDRWELVEQIKRQNAIIERLEARAIALEDELRAARVSPSDTERDAERWRFIRPFLYVDGEVDHPDGGDNYNHVAVHEDRLLAATVQKDWFGTVETLVDRARSHPVVATAEPEPNNE